MTTMLLDEAELDEITRQAREVHPVRALLTLIASVLFGIGWLAYKICAVLWMASAWSFVAVRAGWRTAKVGHGAGRTG